MFTRLMRGYPFLLPIVALVPAVLIIIELGFIIFAGIGFFPLQNWLGFLLRILVFILSVYGSVVAALSGP